MRASNLLRCNPTVIWLRFAHIATGPATGVAEQAPVAKWSPDMLGGGSQLFGSLNDLVGHVNGASVIGSGILTQWNGREGIVRAERIYRGSIIAKDEVLGKCPPDYAEKKLLPGTLRGAA